MRSVSLAVGAEAAARIGRYFGIQISGDTLLWVLRQTPSLASPAPRVVGIDDWAFKKGLRYGTLVVDLERHCPIDLLPDRQAETVTQWLKLHPRIAIITRDRSQEYAQAATQGASQAIQVADRWHLLQNLGDALQQVLERYATRLRKWAVPEPAASTLQAVNVPERPVPRREQQQRALRRKTRLERYEQVHQLHRQGWQQVRIARHLGLCRKQCAGIWRLRHSPKTNRVTELLGWIATSRIGCSAGTRAVTTLPNWRAKSARKAFRVVSRRCGATWRGCGKRKTHEPFHQQRCCQRRSR